jgi:hypothetical protein
VNLVLINIFANYVACNIFPLYKIEIIPISVNANKDSFLKIHPKIHQIVWVYFKNLKIIYF